MRRFIVEVTAFVTLTLAIPLAMELALRLLDVRTEPPVFRPAVRADGTSILRLAWNPQFRKEQPPQPQREFTADKQPGTFRIFVIGESPAEGVPYGTQLSFSAWLDRRLAAQAPEVHWEVVNAALGGLQSWSALQLVRDIARHEPDLLVVYLGHNETGTRFTSNERRWADPRGFAWRAWLIDTRLYAALSRMLPARAAGRLINLQYVTRGGDVSATEGGRRIHATTADHAVSAAAYAARLVKIVRTMRGAGAHTMLLTLSQNFSEWAPAISTHQTRLRPDDKAAWRAAVRQGDALAAHDCPAALAAWSRALALDPTFAELQFKVATCERALGQLDAANARFRLASDLDWLPHGAPTAFNDIVRSVARRENAILVDIDRVFAEASGPRLVGYDLFLDAMHLRLRGHQLIAQAVADGIRGSGVAGSQVVWRPQAYTDPDPETVLDADPTLRTKEGMILALGCRALGRTACGR